MSDQREQAPEATEESEAVEKRGPLDDAEAEDIAGGRGGSDPRDRTIPDGWGTPDPDNPWSIP